jgi:hypothetical protein
MQSRMLFCSAISRPALRWQLVLPLIARLSHLGKVAVLDERGNPLTGTESSDRFNTFAEGPCPVLKALALTWDVPSGTETAARAPWRIGNESRNLAPGNIRLGSTRPLPLFRVFSRLREDLRR